jgi:SAP domain.
VLDGSIENTIEESVSKIQPVRTVIIRRTQLLQSGVLVEDGPTLDEIHAQESADAEEAKIRDASGTEENVDEADEDADDISDEIVDDSVESELKEEPELEDESESIDYSSMKVTELKELLKSQGKPVSGKKSDLIDRLNE